MDSVKEYISNSDFSALLSNLALPVYRNILIKDGSAEFTDCLDGTVLYACFGAEHYNKMVHISAYGENRLYDACNTVDNNGIVRLDFWCNSGKVTLSVEGKYENSFIPVNGAYIRVVRNCEFRDKLEKEICGVDGSDWLRLYGLDAVYEECSMDFPLETPVYKFVNGAYVETEYISGEKYYIRNIIKCKRDD